MKPLTLLVCLCLALPGTPHSASAMTAEQDAWVVYQEGLDFLEKDGWLQAAEKFDLAVDLDPDVFYLLSGNGIFERLLGTGLPGVAAAVRALCGRLIRREGAADPFVYLYLGWSELVLQEGEKARVHLEKASTLMLQSGLPNHAAEDLLKRISPL